MAETTSSSPSLRGLRAQMAAAAQAQAQERRSLATNTSRRTSEAAAKPQGCQPVIDGATLRTDDRLRVAKERREEADRQQAVRGSQIMERDRKAKMQVERQLEERQKKAEEQRKKEEQRRVAVEEKRRQKQEEEKEHYEAVMRRSMERSQRLEQRQKRWSWGGGSPHSDGSTEKRSSSSVSLKQLSDGGINKRLSSSSAALLKSPDQSRALKTRSSSLTRVSVGRAPLAANPDVGTSEDEAYRPPGGSTADGGLRSRLFTPTQASLARSKSAATLSTEGTNAPEFHQCPRSASTTPIHLPPRGPLRSRSSDRQKSGINIAASADAALDQSLKEKPLAPHNQKRPASPSTTSLGRNRSPSPTPKMAPKRTPSPAAVKQIARSRPPSPAAVKQRPPSPQSTSTKTLPSQKPALTPTGATTLRKRESKSRDMVAVQTESGRAKEKEAGTNSAAEATKILAQNRRLMREQKEKEEQQRLQREEEEKEKQQKLQREEEEEKEKQRRLQMEEEEKQRRLQREQDEKDEQQRLQRGEEEEKRLKEEEEEEQRKEEEKEVIERRLREEEEDDEEVGLAEEEEEAVRRAELQKEREEAEAKAQEEAQRVREERNRIMEQNQQERMERRKRIEEIMRRTRKGDSNDVKREEERSSEGNREAVEQTDLQMDKAKCDLSAVEHLEEPVNGTTEEGETGEEKENDSWKSEQSHEGSSLVPKDGLIHDSTKVALVSGLNGKSNQWSFGDLIDVHTSTEDRNQVLISRDGSGGGTKGAFGDPENLIKNLCCSKQPSEAL